MFAKTMHMGHCVNKLSAEIHHVHHTRVRSQPLRSCTHKHLSSFAHHTLLTEVPWSQIDHCYLWWLSMHHSSCCVWPVDPASLPEVCLPLQSGPRRNDPVWPSPWASGQVSGPPCCVGCLQWHIYGYTNAFKLAKEKSRANHLAKYLLCRVIWGSSRTSTRTTA